MKYVDYYAALGVERGATTDEIRKAYRRLAQKHHPDVSKEPGAEAKFKEIGEAYQTLKDAEKRAEYDALGSRAPGEDFQPPPDWARRYGGGAQDFGDLDLGDLFGRFGGGGARSGRRTGIPGQDFEVPASISIEDAYRGTTLELNLSLPEHDATGAMRRVSQVVKARIAPGAVQGQRVRLPGRGGKGFGGGKNGDLYLDLSIKPHPIYRAEGHDLFLDLPLTPPEAALGAAIEVPTLGGAVNLKIPAGTSSGQKLRLGGRGLPRPGGGAGDLFAIAQIVVPAPLSERERELYGELAEVAANPRSWTPASGS